jgi:signal transduction histidine kinase
MALRLLVVDDDEVDRLAVRRALREAGIEAVIDERADDASALAALKAEPYDCVLLDYNLPGVTGLDVLVRIRVSGLCVPVVVFTGQGDEELAVTLMKAGAADYMGKAALTADRLARSVRYAIALHRSEEERRELLVKEQQAREEAQAANRAKDEFLATLSHELRTPLNAILGWAKLLGSGQLDESASRRAVEIIERNASVQVQLIEDMLDISRIITGKLRLHVRPTAVRAVVEAAVESVRHAAEKKLVSIDVRSDEPVMDATILCDPARIQQVLWNLLSNAIKFTPSGGEVCVRAEREEHRLALRVSDTGCGINPAFLPFVFDRFRQQDGASTRLHGGLGLGLSIVRHLTELHGGSVEAHSDGDGLGSAFTVRLPLNDDPLRRNTAGDVVNAARERDCPAG